MPRALSRFAVPLVLVATASTAAAQTVDTAAAVQAAEAATRGWLQLIDEGRYAESWEQAATLFRLAVTKDDWQRAVLQARGPFEPFGERTRLRADFTTELPNAPPGWYVLFQYQTVVAGGRRVVETVVPMLDSAQTWRVSGYFVRPQ